MTAADPALGRRTAVIVAGHLGDSAAITPHLVDPDPPVRAAALAALARCNALQTDQLSAALSDVDESVRLRAAELAATHDHAIDLSGALADDASSVVEMASWACGERPDGGQWIQQLITIAGTHENPLCREAAVASLGAIGDPVGLGAILSACNDKPAIRRRAVLALTPFEGDPPDELAQGEDDPDPVRQAWERALKDRDWQVRQAAEDLLGRDR